MELAQKSTRGSRCTYWPISYFSALLFGWVSGLVLHSYTSTCTDWINTSLQGRLSSYFPLGVGKGKMKEVVFVVVF